MIGSLAENFIMRLNGFRSHATYLWNPFSVEVSNATEKLQTESIELQYDSVLRSSFNQEALIIFYAFFTCISVLGDTTQDSTKLEKCIW
jgi:hypothetical protein